MNTFSQWVHQHDLLLLGSFVIIGCGLLPVLHRRSLRLWLAWFAVVGLIVGGVSTLRTADVSVTSHSVSDADAPTDQVLYAEPSLESVAAIEQFLATGGQLTLVEVQSDFGFD